MSNMQIIFFGNWGVGFKSLEKILALQFPIKAVVTQYNPDTQDEYYNMVYHYAKSKHIPLFQNYDDLLKTDLLGKDCLGISVAYNKLYSDVLLQEMKIINFHPSLLPDFRGPSAIEWQIKSKQDFIGITAHYVDHGTDTGDIILQRKYPLKYDLVFSIFLEEFNESFSDFVITVMNHISKNGYNTFPRYTQPKENAPYYHPRIRIPQDLRDKTISEIHKYLNSKRISFFTGNRAEFGILFPLIHELSKTFYVDIFISGSHLLPPWNSIDEIKEKINKYGITANIISLELNRKEDIYLKSLPDIYSRTIYLLKTYQDKFPYQFAIILGDRIESLAFGLASFYSKIPVIHISGGDVANVPYFDTNIRHSISKLAHIHFTTNERSKKVLEQLGEEDWRVFNIGNLSYDYDRLNLLSTKDDLKKMFDLKEDDFVLLCTYHASPFKSCEENISDFEKLYRVITSSKNVKGIITYPNYDPGSQLLLSFLDEIKAIQNADCHIVTTLGTDKYIALLKYFKSIVIGNSSSGLTETSFYCTPALNIGDRQTDRFRGSNVFDLPIDEELIREKVHYCLQNYDTLKKNAMNTRFFFGNGAAALKAKEIIDIIMNKPKEEILFKKFILKFN